MPGTPRPGVTAIVLAGGRATRFGLPKLEAELGGRPLVHHAIEAVAAVADEVVVVVAPGAGLRLPELTVPARLAHDPEPDGGPLVGLAAGLRAAGFARAVVVGGDMPTLAPAVLGSILRRLDDPQATAVLLEAPRQRARTRDRPTALPRQSLPMALRVDVALAAAEDALARGRRSLQAMLDGLGPVEVSSDVWLRLDPDGATLVDVDDPADLERLRQMMGGPR
jgi:molybdopterin-guanine dinucleotide biosynthesis protein A